MMRAALKGTAALVVLGFLILGLIAGAAVVGATQAKKPPKHYFNSTAVLLDDEPPTFSGRVASPQGGCERGRKVTLHFHGEGFDDVYYGTTTSKPDGTWELTVNEMLPSGGYQFRAGRKKLKPKHGRKRICRKSVPADMELP
jgi:hypothetical protein